MLCDNQKNVVWGTSEGVGLEFNGKARGLARNYLEEGRRQKSLKVFVSGLLFLETKAVRNGYFK